MVVSGADHQRPVGRGVGPERLDARVDVAHPRRRRAGVEERGSLVGQRGQRRREQVHLDPLADPVALADPQRGEDPVDGVQAGDHVDQGDPGLARLAVGRAGDRHQAADRLDQRVVAGHRRPALRPKPVIEQ